MSDDKKDSVAEAQAKVDGERARLSGTIAEIRRRADPRAIVDEVTGNAKTSASHLADNASRIANTGVEAVKRKPAVAGAAVAGVLSITALLAWRGRNKNTAAKRRRSKLMGRASVADVLDPPFDPVRDRVMPFETDIMPETIGQDYQTTALGYSEPTQQETDYGQEQR